MTTDDYLATVFRAHLEAEQYQSVNLGEIAAVNARSATPLHGASLRYVDIAAVQVGSFGYPQRTSWELAPSRARRLIRKGDTLWSTVRPNRRSHALNLHDDPELVGSTGLAILSPMATGFAYLYELTCRPEFSAFLERSAEGSAYPAVRSERFAEAPVPLLSSSRRNSFEAVAAPLRQCVSALDAESGQLAVLRDALLPELMSGRLRVKDAESVAESVL